MYQLLVYWFITCVTNYITNYLCCQYKSTKFVKCYKMLLVFIAKTAISEWLSDMAE